MKLLELQDSRVAKVPHTILHIIVCAIGIVVFVCHTSLVSAVYTCMTTAQLLQNVQITAENRLKSWFFGGKAVNGCRGNRHLSTPIDTRPSEALRSLALSTSYRTPTVTSLTGYPRRFSVLASLQVLACCQLTSVRAHVIDKCWLRIPTTTN